MSNPLPTFGYIAEGATDHVVLDSILAGVFDSKDIAGRPFSPLTDATSQGTPESFGGWENVLNYLPSPRFEEAFQYVDYVIVHVDTDVCQTDKFGVNIFEDGEMLAPAGIVERVIENLKARIGEDVWNRVGHRTIFAIPVDSIECWLLLIYNKKSKSARNQNCLEHLNKELVRQKHKPISGDAKKPRDYENLSKPFSKQKALMEYVAQSDSLSRFTKALPKPTESSGDV